jgi:hypothetical protein
MNQESTTAVLDELFDPVGECLTPDVARRLVGVRASPGVQARLDELAEKSSDGTLTADERRAYESYLRAVNFIGVLQAKARALLASEAGR